MRQLVLQERRDQRDEGGTAGAVVAAECRLPLRLDAILAVAHRHRAGAQWHRIEMRHEQQARARAIAGQRDDQVARLCRQGNARVRVVETDGARRDASFLERPHDLGADRLLLPGDAFHGEEPHQAVNGAVGVEGQVRIGMKGISGNSRPPLRGGTAAERRPPFLFYQRSPRSPPALALRGTVRYS